MTQNIDFLSVEEASAVIEELQNALRDPALSAMVGTKDFKLPSTFEFTSNVVFISNMPGKKIDSNPDLSAIKSRSLYVDINLSKEGTFNRIKSILPFVEPDVDMDIKEEILESLSKSSKALTMRSITAAIAVKKADVQDWQRLVENYA
jgi:hypothetical protein